MKMLTSVGIIVNTFEKLEPEAIRAIMDGAIVDGEWTLISSKGGDAGRSPESLRWLDSQPRGSIGKLLLTTAYISSIFATILSIIFLFFPTTILPPRLLHHLPPPRDLRLGAPSPHSISENHVVRDLIIDSFCGPCRCCHVQAQHPLLLFLPFWRLFPQLLPLRPNPHNYSRAYLCFLFILIFSR